MARRLKGLVVDRVDLVDAGANQHAAVALFKRQLSHGELMRRADDAIARADKILGGSRMQKQVPIGGLVPRPIQKLYEIL